MIEWLNSEQHISNILSELQDLTENICPTKLYSKLLEEDILDYKACHDVVGNDVFSPHDTHKI